MLQFLETGQLSLAGLLFHGVLELGFIVDLHCVFALVTLVEAQSHHCVSTLPDSLSELVIIQRSIASVGAAQVMLTLLRLHELAHHRVFLPDLVVEVNVVGLSLST